MSSGDYCALNIVLAVNGLPVTTIDPPMQTTPPTRPRNRRTTLPALLLGLAFALRLTHAAAPGPLTFERQPAAQFAFDGFTGERIDRTVDHWLLPMPDANPGVIEMFSLRDRQPVPDLVPWAGEFVGKYLISAIQTLRLSPRPELSNQVARVVGQLIAGQAEDGYLGPFRQKDRLRGNWDLWGHYHVIEALLLWHEATGDTAALTCARRMGDLICATYLDTGHRALEAGSEEMNLAIIHGLGQLHRATGEERYLRMMREVEKDWERAGDYFRSGFNGVEFFQSPRPRWESLHDLQGLVELYRITGDARYRTAFEHHWRSIARWDRRNTGGFSSGEQATGNPYANAAIETCCTIAWMALSADMLALTGDARVADALELGTLNGWAGAQHPSGRWCTYNTPMNGVREASAHTIVFQSRAGTPELNCCSVNGPRGWSLLTDWAVMSAADGPVLNWLGPVTIRTTLPNKAPLTLRVIGNYPWQLTTTIAVETESDQTFTLRLRVPEWSRATAAQLNGTALTGLKPGTYLALARTWHRGDQIKLTFDDTVRAVMGSHEARGQASLYRGPILLAWDQRLHSFDEPALPPIQLGGLTTARVVPPTGIAGRFPPQLVVELPAADGRTLRLCDFATAGALGTHYRTWLPVKDAPPAPAVTRLPRDGARIPTGTVAFRWTKLPRAEGSGVTRTLRIGTDEELSAAPITITDLSRDEVLVEVDARFKADTWYFWEVVTRGPGGETHSSRPLARFQIDPAAPKANEQLEPPRAVGPRGEWLSDRLRGKPAPDVGAWDSGPAGKPAEGPGGAANGAVSLDGVSERITYRLGAWPEEDYAVSLRFKVASLPAGRLGQVFSAWAASMDDPLRLVVDNGKLFARIEASQSASTKGAPIETGRWYHVAAVKAGGRLTLFLDGREVDSTGAPQYVTSQAVDCALGGNPHFGGNEQLAVTVADLALFPRGLSADEVKELARP